MEERQPKDVVCIFVDKNKNILFERTYVNMDEYFTLVHLKEENKKGIINIATDFLKQIGKKSNGERYIENCGTYTLVVIKDIYDPDCTVEPFEEYYSDGRKKEVYEDDAPDKVWIPEDVVKRHLKEYVEPLYREVYLHPYEIKCLIKYFTSVK